MAVKTLDQVLSELQGTYQPQIDTLQQRQSAIPDQINQNEQQLQAKQTQAFGDITDAARRRGLGFSGIPLSEQARYTSTDFLPALAKLRQSGQEQAMSLQDAINGVLERRNTLAQQLVSQSQQQDLQERQFQEQIRQFNEQQKAAAAANSFNPSYGGGGGGGFGGGSATATQRADKGFNFTDAYGNPISAAAYAKAKNLDFRNVLDMMAKAGDQGAKTALGFAGNDVLTGGLGYDPNKVNTQALANLYNSLVWGVGQQAKPTFPTANYGTGALLKPPQQSKQAAAPASANRLLSGLPGVR